MTNKLPTSNSRVIQRSMRFIAAAVMVSIFCGCFRYTPSRKELESDGASEIAGAEAFRAYQARLRERLDALVKERAAMADSRTDHAYKIGKGDVLKVEVFGFSDLSGDAEVNDDGNINLPLLGPVAAAETTVGELQQNLTAQFTRYVKKPSVRVSMTKFNARGVSVVGSVARPGWYALKHSGYLLTELLAEAGGPNANGASRVYLIPAGAAGQNGSAAGVEINLDELVGTLEKPAVKIPLVQGDTVVVPEAGQFRVDGEVEQPGSFAVTRGTSTLSAIAAAGGFTYVANVNEVEVIRDIGQGKKASLTLDMEKIAFSGAMDEPLREGDVVIVPSAPGRFRARQVVETFRSIMRGGVSGSIKYQ